MVPQTLPGRRRVRLAITMLLLVVLCPPVRVLAGPPDDGNVMLPPLPVGGPAHSSDPDLWQGWIDSSTAAATAARGPTPGTILQAPMAAETRLGRWLEATFNPGKWVGEAVIGSMAAMIEGIAAMEWEVVSRAMGRSTARAAASPHALAADGCAPSASDPLSNWLLCHPVDSLLSDTGTGSPGWTIARTQEIGTGLLGVAALILLVRLLLRLRGGQVGALAEDGAMALVLGYAGIRLYPTLVRLAMESANQLTTAFAGAGSYDRLYALVEAANSSYGLSLTLALCILILGLTLLYLVVLAVIRLAELALLVVLGPLALVSYAAGNAFGLWSTWLRRLAGNLLTTTVWALGLAFGTNWLWLITGVSTGASIGDQVMTAFIGSIIVLATAELPALLGIRGGSPLGHMLLPLLGGWAPAAQLRRLDRSLRARNPHTSQGTHHGRGSMRGGRGFLPDLNALAVVRSLQDGTPGTGTVSPQRSAFSNAGALGRGGAAAVAAATQGQGPAPTSAHTPASAAGQGSRHARIYPTQSTGTGAGTSGGQTTP